MKKLVIVGGGTAGWMAAAFINKFFNKTLNITLIESPEIATIGVGEATIPSIQLFNSLIKLNEADFLRATQATYKLGIEFNHWGSIGEKYMHAFGPVGKPLGLISFNQYWRKAKQQQADLKYGDFSLNELAAYKNKFAPLKKIPNTGLDGIVHAYHFDAKLYADLLSKLAVQRGVKHIQGQVNGVELNKNNGYIHSVRLASGEEIEADFFIDCSGQKALLIEQQLEIGFESWAKWLPCDRAIAIQTQDISTAPYTQATAHQCGWIWKIPIKNRTGNGIVYSSAHMTDEQALGTLQAELKGQTPISEPNHIRFNVGRREKQWHKNCLALGLSSGFLEPLESTSLHMIQSALVRFIKFFPNDEIQEVDVEEFNRQSKIEAEMIRDFIILHYRLTTRTDSPFWDACRTQNVPATLQRKIDLFAETGRVFRENYELFDENSWTQVLLGQGILPQTYHPIVEQITDLELNNFLNTFKKIINATSEQLPEHHQYIAGQIQ
jgi:tryptophan halogenase